MIILDLNVWHQTQEECNKICTITTQNASCSDPDKLGITRFQFDINLPKSAYSFGKCKSCFNITQINITCMLNKTSMNSEPHSTKNEEITASKIIYEPHSTQNVEITTTKKISRSSGKLFFCFDFGNFFVNIFPLFDKSKNMYHVSVLQMNKRYSSIAIVTVIDIVI